LALPLLALRRQRVNVKKTLKGSAAPPPRRTTGRIGQQGPSYSHAVQSTESNSTSSHNTSPRTGELLAAISRVDFSTAIYAGKAFAIATGLVAVGGVALTIAVKTFMGVQDAREFGHRMRSFMWSSVPDLTARIHRPPMTEDERQDVYLVSLPGLEEQWSWEAAEVRLKKAYDEGGFSLWAQTALRELEAEVRVERTRRQKELDVLSNSKKAS